MTSKLLYGLRTNNLKILTEPYSISKIQHVLKYYVFSNIYYYLLEWNILLIPTTIEKITFIDEFNENFNELFNVNKFKCLKYTNIGIFYTNEKVLDINCPNTINIDELTMTLITNKIFVKDLSDDIKRLHDINSNKTFPSYLGRMSIIKINMKKFKDMSLEDFRNITRSLSINYRLNSHINIKNQYQLQFYFTNYKSTTLKQFNFYKFYCTKMQQNIEKLIEKIFKNIVLQRLMTI